MRYAKRMMQGAALAVMAACMPVSADAQSNGSVSTFTGPGQTINDNATTSTNINIPNFGVNPTKIVISLNGFSHTYISDLRVTVSHNGKSATLLAQQCPGTPASGIVMSFDDTQTTVTCPKSGSYTLKPNTPLSAFSGMSAAGTWTLTIADQATRDTGSMASWGLTIYYNGPTSFSWQQGSYGAWSKTCGTATRARTVTCGGSDGKTYEDAACFSVPKPDTTETSQQLSGCTYAWKTGAYAQVSACGATTETRSVTCGRSDGTTSIDANCTAAKPATSQTSATPNYDSCTYSWNYGAYGDWSTTCGDATRTRPSTCLRSNGTTVADGFCSGTSRQTTDSQHTVTSCTTRWDTGAWATTPACGATDESRRVSCLRSDGYTVADASCTAQKPDTNRAAPAGTTSYSGCTFSWLSSAWSAVPSGTCGYFNRTRTTSCTRSDGAPATATQCNIDQRPYTTGTAYSLSGCNYDWRQSGYTLGACTNGQQTYTASYSCRRSNGDYVASDYCTGRQPTRVSTQSCTYWQAHANDPYADARPGDAAPTGTYSGSGTTTGTSQTPTEGGVPAGSYSGGSYNASTGAYTTPSGQVLEGGYYDGATNTYWDSPEMYKAWKVIQETGSRPGDVIIMRRTIGRN